jgi:hypothetical protein
MRTKLTEENIKSVYSWQFYNCMKLWCLALTTAQQSELALLVHPLVNLINGVIRLSNNLKFFPFQLKAFDLLTMISSRTGQFVPSSQHLLTSVFTAHAFFNAKPKKLEDKSIPATAICLKISKKHMETQEMKDRIVKESLQALTHLLASQADQVSFPEMMVPVKFTLAKFKKNAHNQIYRRNVHQFIELIEKNCAEVSELRTKLRSKSISEPSQVTQAFAKLAKGHEFALQKEAAKLTRAEKERATQKLKIN